MKSAAVIGANSMVGRELVSALSSRGIHVIAIGRHAGADIHLNLASGDLRLSTDSRWSADVLFHCAASFADDSPEGVETNFQVNTASCLRVLDLVKALGATALVYAGSVSSSKLSDATNYSSYGFSKAQAEELLAWGMHRLGGRFCSLRFSQIYDTSGACQRHQPWFGRIIAYAARGLDLNMPASGASLRNFLHLDDVVLLLLRAAESSLDGIVEIAHPQSLSYQDLAQLAYSLFGQGGGVRVDPNKAPFRPVAFPVHAEGYRRLGLSALLPMREGLARIRDQGTWKAFGPLDVA